MCEAILYRDPSADLRIYFKQQGAKLPVLTKSKAVSWLSWGRRKGQMGELPMGGWARLDDILAGRWDEYFPVPVKIPAHGFVESDFQGRSSWFNIVPGQCIQGLVAKYQKERRLYVVTIIPKHQDAPYPRWPRICAK